MKAPRLPCSGEEDGQDEDAYGTKNDLLLMLHHRAAYAMRYAYHIVNMFTARQPFLLAC